MKHPTRYARRRNKVHRLTCAAKQKPLPVGEQLKRAMANARAELLRYPDPPKYRYRDSDATPVQPACYELRPLFS